MTVSEQIRLLGLEHRGYLAEYVLNDALPPLRVLSDLCRRGLLEADPNRGYPPTRGVVEAITGVIQGKKG